MKRPRAIAVGFLLLAAIAAISFLALPGLWKSRDAVDVRDSAAARVDTLFAEWNRSDSPGCSVGVSRNAVPVLERGYGMANLELRVPITPASVFHVASVSKQFTAMSILLLSQRGKLLLDDEVRKHIPEWADHGNRLTIRHLLTHTGGLRDVFLLRELAPPRTGSGDMNDELVAVLARQLALNFAPGSEFQYSNDGYVLLATIVKKVSGQSLRAFADANIFKPLGMTQTHVHDDPRMIVPNRASGYHRDAGGLQVAPHQDLGRSSGRQGSIPRRGISYSGWRILPTADWATRRSWLRCRRRQFSPAVTKALTVSDWRSESIAACGRSRTVEVTRDMPPM